MNHSADMKTLAICVIFGAKGLYSEEQAKRHSWPRLFISQLRRHTAPGYTVFAYAYSHNNLFLKEDEEFLRSCPEVELIDARRLKHGNYQFVWPVRNWLSRYPPESFETIAHFSFDTFPVDSGWFGNCVARLHGGASLIAASRECSGKRLIDPCFVFFSRKDLRTLRFDFSPVACEYAGAGLAQQAEKAAGRTGYFLECSGTRLPAGAEVSPQIFGKMIYSHGIERRILDQPGPETFQQKPKATYRFSLIDEVLMENLRMDPERFMRSIDKGTMSEKCNAAANDLRWKIYRHRAQHPISAAREWWRERLFRPR